MRQVLICGGQNKWQERKKNPTQFQNWGGGVAGSGCSVMCEGSQQFSVSLVFGWTYFCEASFSAMTAVKAALDFQIPVSPKYQAKIKKNMKQPIAFFLVQRCYQWQRPCSERKSSLFLIAQSSKKNLKTFTSLSSVHFSLLNAL